MKPTDILRARLGNQLLLEPRSSALEVVEAFGAVQAQDYPAALWALALRTGGKRAEIEKAVESRAILRTWPMRGTLHFVPSSDARWMLKLMALRVLKSAGARFRQLEIDDALLSRSRKLLEKFLGSEARTRPEIFEMLERAGIATKEQRGVHILGNLSMSGVLCVGPHRGKQSTFVLLDEWAPAKASQPDEEEALAILAKRYFTTHGPATAKDFGWWTGLPLGRIKPAIAGLAGLNEQNGYYFFDLPKPRITGTVYLLPPFDEYTVAYTDRSALLDPAHSVRTRGGIMAPVIVIEGKVAGVWSRTTTKKEVRVTTELFAPAKKHARAVAAAIERYRTFVG